MKLSEAIMLGSTTVKMVPGDINSCALGAACNAMGVGKHHEARVKVRDEGEDNLHWTTLAGRRAGLSPVIDVIILDRYEELRKLWPWIRTEMPHVGSLQEYQSCFTMSYAHWIVRTFDAVVCHGGTTLEWLVDQVRAVEPDCAECNRFNCKCAEEEDKALIREALRKQLTEAFASYGASVPMKLNAIYSEEWKTKLEPAFKFETQAEQGAKWETVPACQ